MTRKSAWRMRQMNLMNVIEESKKKMRAINSAFDKIEKMQLK